MEDICNNLDAEAITSKFKRLLKEDRIEEDDILSLWMDDRDEAHWTEPPQEPHGGNCTTHEEERILPHFIPVDPKGEAELAKLLDTVETCWGLDMFRLGDLTNQKPLCAVTYTILKNRGLLKRFGVREDTLANFLLALEAKYRRVNYHNSTHAADVTQSTNVLLSSPTLNSVFSDLEVFAAIFAAAIHDVEHPGFSNLYMKHTNTDIALRYNDDAILEKNSLAVGFQLVQNPEMNILSGLTREDRGRFWKVVVEIVLATDFSKHVSYQNALKVIADKKRLDGNGTLVLESDSDKIKVLQNLVHCADVSNPTKPLQMSTAWADRIMLEFLNQGIEETRKKLPRTTPDVSTPEERATAQLRFLGWIHPLWESWATLIAPDPLGPRLLEAFEESRKLFSKDQDATPMEE